MVWDSFQPLRITAGSTIEEMISHALKPTTRGPSLYNPVKLLDACPFCDADIVARIKGTINYKMVQEKHENNSAQGIARMKTNVQIQDSHVTGMNRYPDEYLSVKTFIDSQWERWKTGTRILSFGSSTGEKAISLASLYFHGNKYQNVTFYGVDLDEKSVEVARKKVVQMTARESKIVFFNGKGTNIDVHGPYDVIFANNVLCFHGPFPIETVVARLPFNDFQKMLTTLDASLKEGGLLAMVNMNYYFEDTELSKRYHPVAKCQGNFVPRIDRATNTYDEMDRTDWMDCVWVKNLEDVH